MRLSNEIVSGNEKNSKPFFAKVTSASASNVTVQADRECRNLKMQYNQLLTECNGLLEQRQREEGYFL